MAVKKIPHSGAASPAAPGTQTTSSRRAAPSDEVAKTTLAAAIRLTLSDSFAQAEKALREVEQLERAAWLQSEHAEAIQAFLEGLERHAPEGAKLTAADGRRGALAALSRGAWDNALGPLLDSEETRELLGLGSRQAVSERVRAHTLIAMQDSAGRWRFPAFQFDDDGQPYRPLVAAFWVVREHVDGWTAASWLTGDDPALDGLSPLAWHRAGGDDERLARVARQDAARLAA